MKISLGLFFKSILVLAVGSHLGLALYRHLHFNQINSEVSALIDSKKGNGDISALELFPTAVGTICATTSLNVHPATFSGNPGYWEAADALPKSWLDEEEMQSWTLVWKNSKGVVSAAKVHESVIGIYSTTNRPFKPCVSVSHAIFKKTDSSELTYHLIEKNPNG